MYAENVRRFVSSLELLMSPCYNMLCGYKSGSSGVVLITLKILLRHVKNFDIKVNGKFC